jgi:hypothetical protein
MKILMLANYFKSKDMFPEGFSLNDIILIHE